MNVIEKGRDLKKDVYEGKCKICECSFECYHGEVEFWTFSTQGECPNCKQNTRMWLQSQKNKTKMRPAAPTEMRFFLFGLFTGSILGVLIVTILEIIRK